MRVLVVEDEPRMRELPRRALTEDGYAVDVVTDGPQALGGHRVLRAVVSRRTRKRF
ncbi:response regulator [Streptomyces natalensis]|uniref:response regulator n=1 Tax=Streptomyces natalensis TaxID=68242 RepID=UPI000B0919C2|nr:response regulator [Streptomyces natalensis]